MAFFVVNLRMSPSDYWQLTLAQREAILTEVERVHKNTRH